MFGVRNIGRSLITFAPFGGIILWRDKKSNYVKWPPHGSGGILLMIDPFGTSRTMSYDHVVKAGRFMGLAVLNFDLRGY